MHKGWSGSKQTTRCIGRKTRVVAHTCVHSAGVGCGKRDAFLSVGTLYFVSFFSRAGRPASLFDLTGVLFRVP